MKARFAVWLAALAIFTYLCLAALPAQAQLLPVTRGGTGTSQKPTVGQVLVAQPDGTYAPRATSSLGIIGGGGFSTSSADSWLTSKTTSVIAEGTNLYYTLARVQAALLGGYNAVFGALTATSATSTNLAVTGSFNFLGTAITNVATWFSGLFDTNFAAKLLTNLTFGGSVSVSGTTTLATTSTSILNGTIVVDGVAYSRDGYGIQRALNDCATSGGGKVYLPAGTYLATTTIHFPMDAHCSVEGVGWQKQTGGTVIRANAVLSSLIDISGNGYASTNADLNHDNGFKSLKLDGNGLATTTLYLFNQDTVKLEDVTITGGVYGINTIYNGIYPPSASSIPGGLFMHNVTIGVLANRSGIAMNLQNQTQVWGDAMWFEGGSASTSIRISESNKIHLQNLEMNSSDQSIVLADSSTTPTTDVTINDSVFIPNINGYTINDQRSNINSNHVTFEGNTYVRGTSTPIFNGGQTVVQPFTTPYGSNFIVNPNNANFGVGTTSPKSFFELYASAPTLALSDTNVPNYGLGRFVFQNTNQSLRLFQGFLGISAAELHRFTSTGDISKSISIQDTASGVFTGSTLINLPTSGSAYIKNGSGFGIGTSSPSAQLDVVGNPGSTTLLFQVSSLTSGNVSTPVLAIANNGNVGIGTTTPGYALHVNGDIRVEGTNRISFGTNSDNSFNYIGGNSVSGQLTLGAQGAININSGNNSGSPKINFQVNSVTKAVIDGTGNLGIGTTSPAAQLSLGGGNLLIGAATAGGTPGDLLLPKLATSTGSFLAVDATGKVIATTTPSGGGGGVTSVSATYPVLSSGGTTPTISLAFGTTTSNTWAGTQTYTNAPVLGTLTGLLKSASGVLSAAVAGTDYENPLTFSYPLTRVANTISLAFGTSTANTWGATQTFTNAPVLGSLTGIVRAASGVLSTALINLASDVTGVLAVANGGTGLSSVNPGSILFGNGTGALATSSSLFWDNANSRLGIGTSTPAFNLDVVGNEQNTSTSTNALVVGANGATNPAFRVDASTASQASGVKITGAIDGGTTLVTSDGPGANQSLKITTKGSASLLTFDVNGGSGGARLTMNTQYAFTRAQNNAASTARFNYIDAADTALTASTESPEVYFNLGSAIRTHATGAIALQRDFRITGTTHAFAGASTIAQAAALAIDGPGSGGTNATLTNSSGLLIGTSSPTTLSSTTNGFGLSIYAPTGATNNYAASTTGRWIMNALTSSSAGNALCISTTNEISNAGGASCVPSNAQFKDNVEEMKPALEKLMQFHVVTYDYNASSGIDAKERRSMGLIAQQVVKIYPELADYDKNGNLYSIQWERLWAPVIKSIQELKQHDDTQDQEIAELKAEVAALRSQGVTQRFACVMH